MSDLLSLKYQKENLPALLDSMEKEYYSVIKELCIEASLHASELKKIPVPHAIEHYSEICSSLINEIDGHVNLRREVFMPYVQALTHKLNENHDCGICSGHCISEYSLLVEKIRDSHQKIKDILFLLEKDAKPYYLDKTQLLPYKVLRNEIMIMETALSELFYIEETVLIPKIIEAQKATGKGEGGISDLVFDPLEDFVHFLNAPNRGQEFLSRNAYFLSDISRKTDDSRYLLYDRFNTEVIAQVLVETGSYLLLETGDKIPLE